MGKLVVLKLDGDLEFNGFRVTLEIGAENTRPEIEITGHLPPSPDLIRQLTQWQRTYRTLGQPTRIKPHRITLDASKHGRVEECHRFASQLRTSLSQWLTSEDFNAIDRRLREELHRTDSIRMLIRTDSAYLQKLPWHLWDFFERYPLAEVALSGKVFERTPVFAPPEAKKKVRILAILGHAQGINVAKDRQLLENLPNTETVFLVEPQLQQISDRLWEQSWDIIFFAGHSETDGETGRIYINPHDSLTIDELSYGLRKAVERGLKLAIFNSCDGLGLARRLNDLHIPQMIVMRELVPDRVAQKFLMHFLSRFSEGQSFYLAVREARERLQGLEKQYPCATWLPTIYQHPAIAPPTWQNLMRSPNIPPLLASWQLPIHPSLTSEVPQVSAPTPSSIPLQTKIAIASLAGFCLFSWQFGVPQLAKWINNFGLSHYLNYQLPEAQAAFELANSLNPNNRATLFNQAMQCEEVRDFGCAYQKYQQAAKLGSGAAYSNLARLYIKGYVGNKDYDAAVELLWQGIKLHKTQPFLDIRVHYSLVKNLGWARLGQGRYEEALEHLQEAIALDKTRPAAYCLLAQVQEAQGQHAAALTTWQTCLKYAQPQNPDEDDWIGIARQRLDKNS